MRASAVEPGAPQVAEAPQVAPQAEAPASAQEAGEVQALRPAEVEARASRQQEARALRQEEARALQQEEVEPRALPLGAVQVSQRAAEVVKALSRPGLAPV